MKGTWKFQIQKGDYGRPGPFMLWQELANGDIDFIQSVTMQRIGPDVTLGPSSFVLPDEAMHAIMEGLWQAGYRPTGYQEPREHLATMDRHLEDMRAISFKLLKVPKP